MNQILVLRKKILCRRFIVVRAENTYHTCFVETRKHYPGGIFMNNDIGINKPQDIAFRLSCGDIAGSARPKTTAGGHYLCPQAAGNMRCIIRRGIIHDNHLKHFAALFHGHQWRQTLPDKLDTIIDRHNDTD